MVAITGHRVVTLLVAEDSHQVVSVCHSQCLRWSSIRDFDRRRVCSIRCKVSGIHYTAEAEVARGRIRSVRASSCHSVPVAVRVVA